MDSSPFSDQTVACTPCQSGKGGIGARVRQAGHLAALHAWQESPNCPSTYTCT